MADQERRGEEVGMQKKNCNIKAFMSKNVLAAVQRRDAANKKITSQELFSDYLEITLWRNP